MLIRTPYKTKDEVPEADRDSAIELKDGSFIVVQEDSAELTSALETERRNREAAEKSARKAAADLRKIEQEAKGKSAGLSEEQIAALRTELRKEVEDEYAPFKADAEKYKAENRALKLDTTVKQIAATVGFLPERLGDLWKLHADEFDLSEDGKPIVKAAPGTDPKRHLEGIAKARPEWVKGSEAAGGGAGGSGAGSGRAAASIDVLTNPRAAIDAARAEGKVA